MSIIYNLSNSDLIFFRRNLSHPFTLCIRFRIRIFIRSRIRDSGAQFGGRTGGCAHEWLAISVLAGHLPALYNAEMIGLRAGTSLLNASRLFCHQLLLIRQCSAL